MIKAIFVFLLSMMVSVPFAQDNGPSPAQPVPIVKSDTGPVREDDGKKYLMQFIAGSKKCHAKRQADQSAGSKCFATLNVCQAATSKTWDFIELQRCIDDL